MLSSHYSSKAAGRKSSDMKIYTYSFKIFPFLSSLYISIWLPHNEAESRYSISPKQKEKQEKKNCFCFSYPHDIFVQVILVCVQMRFNILLEGGTIYTSKIILTILILIRFFIKEIHILWIISKDNLLQVNIT